MEMVNLSNVKPHNTTFENQSRLKSSLSTQAEPANTLYVKYHTGILPGASGSPTSSLGHLSFTKALQFNMKICSALPLYNSASHLHVTL